MTARTIDGRPSLSSKLAAGSPDQTTGVYCDAPV
jgi:hypothetical protein